MKPDLTCKLFSRFPLIYRQHTLPKEESSMFWGIRCGDGWFDLIWGLSEEIEAIANAQGFAIPEMTEIKQKMGRLVVRTTSDSLVIKEAIIRTQEIADHTCEICAMQGELKLVGNLATVRCEAHS